MRKSSYARIVEARLRNELKHYGSAIDAADQALQIDPESTQARIQKSNTLFAQGRFHAALSMVNPTGRVSPPVTTIRDLSLIRQSVRMYWFAHRRSDARQAAAQIINGNDQFNGVRYGFLLADILHELGLDVRADNVMNRVMDMKPQAPEVHRLADAIKKSLGKSNGDVPPSTSPAAAQMMLGVGVALWMFTALGLGDGSFFVVSIPALGLVKALMYTAFAGGFLYNLPIARKSLHAIRSAA